MSENLPTHRPDQVTTHGEPAGSGPAQRRVTIQDLAAAKATGNRWSMLTSYDAITAQIFDAADIPVLLVGDSAANVVYGYDSTVPVTVDELLPLVRGVVRGSRRAMIVADLPFGSYQESPAQALRTATRFMKEAGAQAVKLEGGARVVPQAEALVEAGIPVMAHLGLTPQSVHAIGGYRVQGRGETGQILLQDAKALQQVGVFAVVLELVPHQLAESITSSLAIPTIGIGAGPHTDAQVLVWQDLVGLTPGPAPRFVKRYADLRGSIQAAVTQWSSEVAAGTYPGPEHSYS